MNSNLFPECELFRQRAAPFLAAARKGCRVLGCRVWVGVVRRAFGLAVLEWSGLGQPGLGFSCARVRALGFRVLGRWGVECSGFGFRVHNERMRAARPLLQGG